MTLTRMSWFFHLRAWNRAASLESYRKCHECRALNAVPFPFPPVSSSHLNLTSLQHGERGEPGVGGILSLLRRRAPVSAPHVLLFLLHPGHPVHLFLFFSIPHPNRAITDDDHPSEAERSAAATTTGVDIAPASEPSFGCEAAAAAAAAAAGPTNSRISPHAFDAFTQDCGRGVGYGGGKGHCSGSGRW